MDVRSDTIPQRTRLPSTSLPSRRANVGVGSRRRQGRTGSHMRARVTLLSPEAGGRRTPIRASADSHYMPHIVVDGGEYLGVRITLAGSDLSPGETTELIIDQLYAERVDYSALTVGTRFELHEGPNVVGYGVIVAP